MDQVRIGRFIAQVRKENSLTQRQLADILGISDKTVSKWETGNGLPEVSLMLPLCQALDVSVNELLSGERITEADYRGKAESNMMSLLREKSRQLTVTAIVCTAATIFTIALGGLLSLRVGAVQPTWLGNAAFTFDRSGFLATTGIFLGFAVLFAAVQILLGKRKGCARFQYVPTALTAVGLLFCLAVYLGAFGTGSPSVIAENRYFAMFLSIPVGGAFVGSLAGAILPVLLAGQGPSE